MGANALAGIFWLILASLVSVETYGEISYYLAIGGFAGTLVMIGIPTFVISLLGRGVKLGNNISSFLFITATVGSVISYVLFEYLPLSIFIFGLPFFVTSVSDMVGRGQFKEYAICNIGQKASQIALPIGLYFLIGFDGILYGFAITFLIFGYRSLSYLKNFTINFTLLIKERKFLFDNWALEMSQIIGLSIDKFLIGPLFGFNILGIYQLGIQFLLLQSIIPNVMFTYLLREESRGVNRRYVKLYGVLVTILSSVLVTLLAPYVIPVLFSEFTEAIPLIQISTWGAPLMALNSIFISKFLGLKKSKPILLAAAIFATILYSSMYLLGTTMGSFGLIISMVLSLGCQTIFLYSVSRMMKK